MRKKIITIMLSIVACLSIMTGLIVGLVPENQMERPTEEELPIAETGAANANISEKGGVVYVASGSKYTMTEGTIIGATKNYGGAVYVENGATFIMSGGTIESASALYGGAIYVEAGGTCSIEGGTINGCNADYDGGAIYVESGANFTMIAGTLSNNQAGTLNEDGSIKTNGFGGAICFNGNGRTEPTATSEGSKALNITGGTISGNISTQRGSGIFASSAIVNITGKTIINGNLTYKEGGGISLNAATLNLGTTENLYTGDAAATFTGAIADNSTYNLTRDGGGLFLTGGSIVNHRSGTVGKATIDGTTYSGNNASNGGGVFVYTNSTYNLSGGKIVGNTAEYSGGGVYVVTHSGSTQNSVFNIESGSSSINENKANGVAAEGKNYGGGGVYVATSNESYTSEFNMLNGGIDFNESAKGNGGGVYIVSGKVKIRGGNFTGNKALNGGGLYTQTALREMGYHQYLADFLDNIATGGSGGAIYSNLSVWLKDCEISCNSATASGGAVYCTSSVYLVAESEITYVDNNSAGGNGGGVCSQFFSATGNGEDVKIIINDAGGNGGGVYVNNGFNATNVEISENESTLAGGGVYYVSSEDGTNFKMTGCILNKNKTKSSDTSAYGGALYLGSAATLTDVTITENSATQRGGAIYTTGSNSTIITITGKSVIANNICSKEGGGICVSGSKLVLDSSFTGAISGNNTSSYSGGGVFISGSGILLQQAGIIGSATIDDVEYSGNTSATGGGVGMYTGSQYTLEGGSVTGNTAQGQGGGVFVSRGTFNLSGGTIENNNTTKGNGGGVNITTEGKFTMSAGVIQNNYAGTLNDSLAVTAVSDSSSITAVGNGGGIYSDVAISISGNSQILSNTAVNGGGIYSLSTVSASDTSVNCNTATIGGGIYCKGVSGTYLSLNQNVASYDSSNSDSGLGGGIYATSSVGGDYLYVQNCSARYGAGIYSKGAVTLTNPHITDNTYDGSSAVSGGGIYSGSDVELTYGKISGCKAMSGGGVCAAGKVTVNGTTIKDNSSDSGGGVRAASFEMTSGEISGNSALYQGGGVYSLGETTITGGSIDNNSCDYIGGGLRSDGALSLSNCSFTGNKLSATSDAEPGTGGAVYASNTATLSNVTISGGDATYNAMYGGGIYACKDLSISGGTIESCVALCNGGGVYAHKTFTMDSGTISGNTASGNGGGVYMVEDTSAVNITGGNIGASGSVNKAVKGGGIYLKGATITSFSGVSVNYNEATDIGGGVYLSASAATFFTNVSISNNTAPKGAGLDYSSSSKALYIRGTSKINSNTATEYGGGILMHGSSIVYLEGSTQVNSNTVTNTSDSVEGGGIDNVNGTLYIRESVSVSNNSVIGASSSVGSSAKGGGIFVCDGGYVSVSSANAVIGGNVLSGKNTAGGNIYVDNASRFSMTNGTIEGTKDSSGNYTNLKQADLGGGIGSIGTVSITGGTVKNCRATNGGGVASFGNINFSTTLPIIGTQISFKSTGNLTVQNASVIDNTADCGPNIACGGKGLTFGGTVNVEGIFLAAIEGSSGLYSAAYPTITISKQVTAENKIPITFGQGSLSLTSQSFSISSTSTMMEARYNNGTNNLITYSSLATDLDHVDDFQDNIYVNLSSGEQYFGLKGSTTDIYYYDSSYLDYTAGSALTDFIFDGGKVIATRQFKGAVNLALTRTNSSGTSYNITELTSDLFKNMNITSFTAQNQIATIPSGAFHGCSYLALFTNAADSSVATTSVGTIGDSAFRNCSALTSVTGYDKISVGDNGFNGCSQMSSYPKIAGAGVCSFQDNTNLSSLYIDNFDDSLTTIGYQAFLNCSKIVYLEIPDSVTTIDIEAFKACTLLTDVTLGAGLTVLNSIFYGCTSLMTIRWSSTTSQLTEIKNTAFSGCENLKYLHLPQNVSNGTANNTVTISSDILSDNTILATLDLGNCITNDAFASLDLSYVQNSLSQVILSTDTNSPNITTIPAEKFYGFTNLQTVVFGGYNIQSAAFAECSSLSNLTIDNTSFIGPYAFYNCTSLSGDFTISSKVEIIDDGAFSNTGITSVTFNGSTVDLGEAVFMGCSSLTSVTLPSALTIIPSLTFANSGLVSITVPDSVTSIKPLAFSECISLQQVYLNDTGICEYYTEESVDANGNVVNKTDATSFLGFLGLTTLSGAAVGLTIAAAVGTTALGLTIGGAAIGIAAGVLLYSVFKTDDFVMSAFYGCKRASSDDATDGLTIHYNSLHLSFNAAEWRCLDYHYDSVLKASDCARIYKET